MTTEAYKPWIQLSNGKPFEPYDCTKDDIDIEVIAHSLSKLCRFNGHTKRFYSVAEHSIHVANLLPDELKIYGLLHDAHEAYTGYGDVCNPIKTHDLRMLERSIDWEIALHFGLDRVRFYWPAVKEADLIMLHTEKVHLMSESQRPWEIEMPEPVKNVSDVSFGLDPYTANIKFLKTFEGLI